MLVDLFMPVMNGAEFLKVVKQTPKLASIPRVIMTAANDPMIGVREDVTVLYKPVDFDALNRLLVHYCEPPRRRPDDLQPGALLLVAALAARVGGGGGRAAAATPGSGRPTRFWSTPPVQAERGSG